MPEPYIGEIKLTSFNFAPRFWAACDGQLLPINQNQALFSLLGTTYGGDGRTTFALPDLRGRTPVHMGNGIALGEQGGERSHTLTLAELAPHRHPAGCSSQAGDQAGAEGHIPARDASGVCTPYSSLGAELPMVFGAVAGGGEPHENMPPYLSLSFIIALAGVFPTHP